MSVDTVKSPWRLWAGLVVLCLALTACDKGPFAPEARMQAASRDQYLKLLREYLVTDGAFEWNTLSSALIVRALPYAAAISQAADRRFTGDPTFEREVGTWDRPAKRSSGPPVVVLLGLFSQDITADDLIKLGRFRPALVTSDGRVLAPMELKRYGRDAVFIRDHFPVFNPWEEVYLVRFDVPAHGRPGWLEFRLEWPGGAQTLFLNEY